MNEDTKKNTIKSLSQAIVVAAVVVAIAIFTSRAEVSPVDVGAKGVVDTVENNSLLLYPVDEDDHIRGAQNPKVTIVEFSDLGCHFCGVLHPSLIRLVQEYPQDLQWVYRQLPFRDVPGAYASECFARLGGAEAFWDFLDTGFATAETRSPDWYRNLAAQRGFDMVEYDACLDSEEIASAVQKDQIEATILDIRATPYSVIITSDGREFPVRGAVPYETLKQLLTPFLQ